MSEPTLEQLARLRQQAVDQARHALALAERARDACAEVCVQARETCASRAREVDAARGSFASGHTVAALHWASAATERALALRCEAQTALRRAEQRLALAEREVGVRAEAVRAHELARRVVTRTLERRAQAVKARTEQRLEDELDDAARTRSYMP